MADQFDPEQVLDFPFLPVGGGDSIGQRRQLRLAGGQRYAHQHKGVRRVKRIEVVNEKDIVPTARVFGKYASQPALKFLVKHGTERAGQFEFRVQVKLVGLWRMGLFDLLAEAMLQFLEDGAKGREKVHIRNAEMLKC